MFAADPAPFAPLLALAGETGGSPREAIVSSPAGILAFLLAVLAAIFGLGQTRAGARFFRIVPMLVFCYFVPTTLTTAGVLPAESPLYAWIRNHVLPAALLLLILALDVPAILRLGPKALIMMLAGTAGVVLGGPLALWICRGVLPPDAWQGMTALAGSWIGGGANFIALGDIAGASPTMMAMMVVPDVFVASIWMGVLLFAAGRQHDIDRRTGADASAIRELERRLSEYHARVARIPGLGDLMMIVALGFGASWISAELGSRIFAATSGVVRDVAAHVAGGAEAVAGMSLLDLAHAIDAAARDNPAALGGLPAGQALLYPLCRFLSETLDAGTWKYILVTTIGVLLSFTAVRRLEGAGASKIGSVMLYLLVACIGASADFNKIIEEPYYILMGFVWMSVHVTVLLVVGWLIKAPVFLIAVGSQANIGGAASAPVVAAAYHPALAPVGALLAVLGYVLGTYAGIVCMHMLKAVAGG